MSDVETHANDDECHNLDVPEETCYIRFGDAEYGYSKDLGHTIRGEMVHAEYDKTGRLMAIELVAPGKPCM